MLAEKPAADKDTSAGGTPASLCRPAQAWPPPCEAGETEAKAGRCRSHGRTAPRGAPLQQTHMPSTQSKPLEEAARQPPCPPGVLRH